jgi:ABC-2 type transport system permease protein
MVAGHFAFGVNWGEPAAAALALTGQVLAATGLGVLLIAFVKNTRQGGPVLGGGLTALGMLGGLFTANLSTTTPKAMEMIGILIPQAWVLKSWEMVLEGQSGSALLIPFAVVTFMGVVMFAIGAMLFRRRFA